MYRHLKRINLKAVEDLVEPNLAHTLIMNF